MKSLCVFLTACCVFAATTKPACSQVPLEWAVEGPITAIDPAASTITAMGMPVQIPADLVLGGTANITGATLNLLLDSAAPSRIRSIFESPATSSFPYSAGTLKAEGEIVETPDGLVFVATAAVVELAENVILGVLESVDTANNGFILNGVNVVLNPDERFPADILDAGGEPISLVDLGSATGQLVGVVGYFAGGVMYAQLVETEVVPVTPGMDTVRITRAQGRIRNNNRNELRVEGIVTPFDANAIITLADANSGTIIGTVSVAVGAVANQGEFRFRDNNQTFMPTRIRATSSNGGTHEFDVEIRN